MGEDPLGEAAGGFVKIAVFVVFAAIDPEKAAVGEISAEAEDILGGESRKALVSGQNQHGIAKQSGILGGEFGDVDSDLDRGAFGKAQ